MNDPKEKMYNLVFITVSLFALAFALTNQMDAHREDYSRMLASNSVKASEMEETVGVKNSSAHEAVAEKQVKPNSSNAATKINSAPNKFKKPAGRPAVTAMNNVDLVK